MRASRSQFKKKKKKRRATWRRDLPWFAPSAPRPGTLELRSLLPCVARVPTVRFNTKCRSTCPAGPSDFALSALQECSRIFCYCVKKFVRPFRNLTTAAILKGLAPPWHLNRRQVWKLPLESVVPNCPSAGQFLLSTAI